MINAPANAIQTCDITFKKPFSKIPTVVCTVRSGSTNAGYGDLTAFVDFNSVTTTGFTIKLANSGSYTYSPNVFWIAIVA